MINHLLAKFRSKSFNNSVSDSAENFTNMKESAANRSAGCTGAVPKLRAEGHNAARGKSGTAQEISASSNDARSDMFLNPRVQFTDSTSRLEKEKERQYQALQDQLRNVKLSSGQEDPASSDNENLQLHGLRSSMSKSQKHRSDARLASRLQQAGALFPDEDSDSGEDTHGCSCKCSASGRAIVSGRKVKRRPVKRTELWPHIISAEESGNEVTAGYVSSAEFYVCLSSNSFCLFLYHISF